MAAFDTRGAVIRTQAAAHQKWGSDDQKNQPNYEEYEICPYSSITTNLIIRAFLLTLQQIFDGQITM